MADIGTQAFHLVSAEEYATEILDGNFIATHTINLGNLVEDELSSSGSYELKGIRSTSFGKLLDALPIPAFLFDAKQRVRFVNHSCAKITPEYLTALGSSFGSLFPREDIAEKARHLFETILEDRKQQIVEAVVQLRGRRLFGRLHLRSLRLGGERSILLLVEDLTLEKKQIIQSARFKKELERQVEERTAMLRDANEKLREEISQRALTQEQLRRSLEEKEVLLREIHHRVKNNLQIMSSLLKLQSEYVKDRELLGLFSDAENRIRSMSLVHELLYQSKNMARVSIETYLTALIDHIRGFYGPQRLGVSIVMDIGDAALPVDVVIPVGFIVTELFSNCLKHAFPAGREGEVVVRLHEIGDALFELSVSDNGVGLPDHIDVDRPESLGLDLVDTFVQQLHARKSVIIRNPTQFTITFSIANKNTSDSRPFAQA